MTNPEVFYRAYDFVAIASDSPLASGEVVYYGSVALCVMKSASYAQIERLYDALDLKPAPKVDGEYMFFARVLD